MEFKSCELGSRKLGEYEMNAVMGMIGNSNDCVENLLDFGQTWAVNLKKLKEKMDSKHLRRLMLIYFF